MKKFAVILIIAVLALGCVFATAGDSQKTDANTVTSGDNFWVTTTIKTIYPVYKISGSNTVTNVESTAKSDATNTIEGIVADNGDKLSIYVNVFHFGKADNDMDASKGLVDIRYKGKVTVTITGNELINQTSTKTAATANAVNADGHVYKSDIPTAGTFTAKNADNLTVECSNSANAGTIVATYTNGKKVAISSTAAAQIASGSFTWDISQLTAGDNYKAEVVVTYTNV